MKVGLIQSNYLPWKGYFDFIDDVDLFIFYDDVQYTKNDWRNRNKIKTQAGLTWLTVPVIFSLRNKTFIQDARIDYKQNWQTKHIKSIKQSYQKAAFYEKYADSLFEIIKMPYETISELNVELIKWIMDQLNIDTKLMFSNELQATGYKTVRIINILNSVGGTDYLTGPAAQSYLEEEKFTAAGIGLEYKIYDYPEYSQLNGKFEPNVSVIDLLFNCGDLSREYLKSKRPNLKAL